jgi:hypothetical protein
VTATDRSASTEALRAAGYPYTRLGQWNAQQAKAEAAKGGGQAIANLGEVAQTRIDGGNDEIQRNINRRA